nr:LOW QUALITY PROTEIN: transmembrane and ubiquitin-like domain-containing protein 1 [Lytechinus pictus]XP_054775426.1 transmembrane and ubiquitin-like domain-containing protein 1 [Lytechinus pictus]
MSLIEGIGDEVTILVTVIVAVTTVVAAWFSTSVTEQQPYWQDEPAVSGSSVDPEPLSQQSTTYSDDGLGEVREATEGVTSGISSEGLQVSSEDSVRNVQLAETELHVSSEDQAALEERVFASSSACTESLLKNEESRYEEGPKQNTPSQNSSFECIEATDNLSESSTLKISVDSPGLESVDGVSSSEKSSSDFAEERVEDVQIHLEEQSVRRRQIPSTCTAAENSDIQTAQNQTDQSPLISGTETHKDNHPENTSHDNVRTNQPQLMRDQASSGVITIKLRFLDETERLVSTNIEDTLGNFKRDTFSSELQSGQTVRLISNGQLLSEESRTLASYGITNQQVIHCQISQASSHTHQEHQNVDTGDGDFDLGRYMVPLFACILAFMWYLRFQYRYMFNATSTLSLTAVTAVFILALLAVWRA